jgi:hypothetical protein
MKSSPDGLDTAKNVFGSAKLQKRASTASIPAKKSLVPQNMKTSLTPSVPSKMNHGAQKVFGSAKLEKQDPTPSVPPKTCPGAQNLKMSPDALGNT